MTTERHEPVSLGLFCPEVIPITIGVVLTPVWCARLMVRSHVIYACLVAMVAIVGVTGFVWSMVRRKRWLAWLVMVATGIAFVVLNLLLPPADRFIDMTFSRNPAHSVEALNAAVRSTGHLQGGVSLHSEYQAWSGGPPNNRLQATAGGWRVTWGRAGRPPAAPEPER